MIVKMNIIGIIKNYFNTFKDDKTDKVLKIDIFIYFIIPLLSSLLIVYYGFLLTESNANIFLTAFSIFAALLFNMLFLLFDIVKKTVEQNSSSENLTETKKTKVKLLKETFTNISFTVLLSVTIVIILLLFIIFIKHIDLTLLTIFGIKIILRHIMSFMTISLIIMFMMSFLMVLKRVDILLSKEV